MSRKSAVVAREKATYLSFHDFISNSDESCIPNAQIEYSERTPPAKMITLPDALEGKPLQIPKIIKPFLFGTLPDEKLHEPVSIVTKETQNSDTEIEDAENEPGSYVSAEDVTPTELKEYPMDV